MTNYMRAPVRSTPEERCIDARNLQVHSFALATVRVAHRWYTDQAWNNVCWPVWQSATQETK